MKKLLYIFSFTLLTLILFTFTGCKKKQVKIPSGVIEKEQMISVMVDVNLVEAAQRVKQSSESEDSSNVKAYYEVIFKKHKITKQQFNTSLAYYTKRPDKFGEIYDEVLNRLSRLQSEVNSKK